MLMAILQGLGTSLPTSLEPVKEVAVSTVSLTAHGDQSNSLVVYGSALATLVAILWAILERRERLASHQLNAELSVACRQVIEQHYRERVQAEERHLLTHDSTVRNILESLERSLLGKPRP